MLARAPAREERIFAATQQRPELAIDSVTKARASRRWLGDHDQVDALVLGDEALAHQPPTRRVDLDPQLREPRKAVVDLHDQAAQALEPALALGVGEHARGQGRADARDHHARNLVGTREHPKAVALAQLDPLAQPRGRDPLRCADQRSAGHVARDRPRHLALADQRDRQQGVIAAQIGDRLISQHGVGQAAQARAELGWVRRAMHDRAMVPRNLCPRANTDVERGRIRLALRGDALEVTMPSFDPRPLPILDKAAFPLGLACNYGIDSEGVRVAVDAGVNYLFWPGMRCKPALEGVREALAKDRDRMILAAGTGGPFGFHFRSRVEAILSQLNTDYIDVFQMFWLGVASWDNRSVMDTLLELREQGKIRAIGVTIHDRARAGRLAADSELDMLQVRYNAAHSGAEHDIFPHLPRDRRFLVAYTATSWRKLLSAPAGWERPVATAADCYRFCLSHPAISVVLTGPASTEQLRENLAGLAKGPLDDDEQQWMRELGDRVHHPGKAARQRGAANESSPELVEPLGGVTITDAPLDLHAWDFIVRHFDGQALEILGGVDETLHAHPAVRLAFRGVSYVDCPTAFRHAIVRIASAQERHQVERRSAVDADATVYAIDAETLGSVDADTFFVVAHDAKLEMLAAD